MIEESDSEIARNVLAKLKAIAAELKLPSVEEVAAEVWLIRNNNTEPMTKKAQNPRMGSLGFETTDMKVRKLYLRLLYEIAVELGWEKTFKKAEEDFVRDYPPSIEPTEEHLRWCTATRILLHFIAPANNTTCIREVVALIYGVSSAVGTKFLADGQPFVFPLQKFVEIEGKCPPVPRPNRESVVHVASHTGGDLTTNTAPLTAQPAGAGIASSEDRGPRFPAAGDSARYCAPVPASQPVGDPVASQSFPNTVGGAFDKDLEVVARSQDNLLPADADFTQRCAKVFVPGTSPLYFPWDTELEALALSGAPRAQPPQQATVPVSSKRRYSTDESDRGSTDGESSRGAKSPRNGSISGDSSRSASPFGAAHEDAPALPIVVLNNASPQPAAVPVPVSDMHEESDLFMEETDLEGLDDFDACLGHRADCVLLLDCTDIAATTLPCIPRDVTAEVTDISGAPFDIFAYFDQLCPEPPEIYAEFDKLIYQIQVPTSDINNALLMFPPTIHAGGGNSHN